MLKDETMWLLQTAVPKADLVARRTPYHPPTNN